MCVCTCVYLCRVQVATFIVQKILLDDTGLQVLPSPHFQTPNTKY